MTADLRARLATLVASVCHPPADPAAVSDDSVLTGGGLDLDSLSVLELVVGLEKWGIEVPAADVNATHFGTFRRLLAYVAARSPSAVPPASRPGA